MILSLIVVQIKTPNMKKVFHKIYWNLANHTGDAARETYAFAYAKPPSLVMKAKLILTFIKTIDIGLKQRLMKN